MKPVSAKRQRRDRIYPQRRREVWERSGGRCEVVVEGARCPRTCQQVHHLAGRGGTDPHRLDNLLGTCADCHAAIHNYPAWSYHHGLMRSRHGEASA